MVVDGGHEEDAATFAVFVFGVFEPGDLEHHGDGLDDKDSADHDEQKFLADDDGDVAEEAAEGEGAGVAHEDAGWVAVEPEKAEGGAGNGGGEDGHLARGFGVGG